MRDFGADFMANNTQDNITLQEIMNDVSSLLGAASSSPSQTQKQAGRNSNDNRARNAAPREALSELAAFCRLDPLMAELHKQYIDAKILRAQATCEYGADDGMSDMARINEDSAWCAMQTRYMELRSDRALMAQAQEMVREDEYDVALQKRLEEEREALKIFYLLQLSEQMAEKRKPQEGFLYLIWWFSIAGIQSGPEAFQWFPTHQFNRIAA